MSFFESATDYNPAFFLYSGVEGETDKLEDGVMLNRELHRTITQIEVVKEANKSAQLSMGFSYGVRDKLLPLPWIQTATLPGDKKDSLKQRKILLNARYNNLTLENRTIYLVKQVTSSGKSTYASQSPKGTGGTTTEVGVLKKIVERDGKKIKFYKGHIQKEVTVFSGVMSRPTGGGTQDAIIRISANAQSALRLWGGNPLRTKVSDVTSTADFADTPSTPGKPDLIGEADLSVFGAVKTYFEKSFGAKFFETTGPNKEKKFRMELEKPNSFVFDISELQNVARTKAEASSGASRQSPASPTNIPDLNTPLDFVKKVCSAYNLDYTFKYLSSGREEIILYAKEGSFLQNIVLSEPKQVDAEFALYLAYGLGVLSFNWASTTFATASGGSASISEGKSGQLAIGYINENGIQYETKIDEEKIKDWVAANGGGEGADAIELAIEFARSNADAFIAYFVDIMPNGLTPTHKPVGYGQAGITLSIDLKWAIPGLSPGTLIYFDSASPDDMALPDMWIGFYKISKVTDKFNPKENIWTQSIECVR